MAGWPEHVFKIDDGAKGMGPEGKIKRGVPEGLYEY